MAATRTTPTGEERRASDLLAMGFTPTQALLLATTQTEGEHVDLERIRWMIDAGCDHELAVRIVV